MTEPIFQIITLKQPQISQKQTSSVLYQKLHQNYISHDYGYYSEIFIKSIFQKAINSKQNLLKFPLRKLIRETVKKYLMNDLQIIFLGYFAQKHQWNHQHPVIVQALVENQQEPDLNQQNKLKFFLSLVCYFVKTYVGEQTEVSTITQYYRENLPLFLQVYTVWIEETPKDCFRVSPRQLNLLYMEHSKTQSSNRSQTKKDYNLMVDKVLELSTTYSTFPQNQKKKVKKQPKSILHEQTPQKKQTVSPIVSRNRYRRNQESNLFFDTGSRISLQELKLTNKRPSFSLLGNTSFLRSGLSHKNGLILQEIGSQQKKQKKQICTKDLQENSEKGSSKLEKKNKYSLQHKRKMKNNSVNDATKIFFQGQDIKSSVNTVKQQNESQKSYMNNSNSFLDLNFHSSRLQPLPFNLRTSSNIFGPSLL